MAEHKSRPQTIFRIKKETKFTTIANQTINDKRLSPEALGLLVYLLSKPDDWPVRDFELKKRFALGRKKLDRMIAELKKAGYLVRHQFRNDQGQFVTETLVYEVSTLTNVPKGDNGAVVPKPDSRSPDSGKSDNGKGDKSSKP